MMNDDLTDLQRKTDVLMNFFNSVMFPNDTTDDVLDDRRRSHGWLVQIVRVRGGRSDVKYFRRLERLWRTTAVRSLIDIQTVKCVLHSVCGNEQRPHVRSSLM